MGIKWKKYETESLLQQFALGTPIEKVVILGRSPDRIRRKALKIGLIEKSLNPPLTAKEKTKLRKLRKQGFSVKTIAKNQLLGKPYRSQDSIQKLCGKLKLVQKNRSRAGQKKKIWKPGEMQIFIDFLKQYSATLSARKIAKKFDVKKITVTSWQKKLGLNPPLSVILAMLDVKEKRQKSLEKRSSKMLAEFEEHIQKREKYLEELVEKLRSQKRIIPLEEKICKKCQRIWLKHTVFFFHTTAKRKSGSSWYFYDTCKICVAKKRHEKNVAKHQIKYKK